MKKLLLVVTISVLLYLDSVAQSPNPNLTFQNLINVTTTSPEAASLGKFGNVPVSYCTGIPSISIPIYQINTGNIKLPISLDYHAGGIRVDETSSSVGTGWALSGIGMISRNMVGLPDELNGPAGFIGAPDPVAAVGNPAAYATYLYSLKNGQVDAEPDIFQYNIAGQSGKFIFNKDGSVLQIPLSNNKITFSSETFTIVDETGIVYIFDQGLTTTSSNTLIPQYIHMWRLSKILASNSTDTVFFKYDNTCNQSIEHPIDVSYSLGLLGMSCQDEETGIQTCQEIDIAMSSGSGQQQRTHTQTTTHYESYVNEIDWRGGKMVFTNACDRQDVTGSGERLKQVDIYSLQNGIYALVRTLKLTQSYFFSNPTNVTVTEKNYRLRLDNVGIYPVNSTDLPQVYTMSYDNSPIAPRESGVQDRWGFYNPLGSLMPNQTQLYGGLYYNFGSGTNETDETAMHACTLNSIQYPTGGKTVFTMEGHKYHAQLPKIFTRGYECDAFGGVQSSNQISFTVNDPNPAGFYYRVNISAFGNCTTTGGGCPANRPTVTFFDQTANSTLMTIGIPPGGEHASFTTGTVAFSLISGHTYVVTSNIFGATNTGVNITATIGWGYSPDLTDEIKIGGGQRIKSIANFDSDGSFISGENYQYGTDNTGVAITPQYYQDVNFEKVVNLLECYFPQSPCGTDWDHFEPEFNPAIGYSLIFHSNSILPTSQYCGSPVLYPLVTKYQVDKDGNQNGKTIYNYNVLQDGQLMTNTPVVAPTPLTVPATGIYLISNTWQNGLLTSEEVDKIDKSVNPAVYPMISKKEYGYNTSARNLLVNVLKSKSNYLVTSNYIGEQGSTFAGRDFSLSSVPIRTGPVFLQSVTETTKDASANTIITTENYTYGDQTHLFPTSRQMVNSKAQTITENLKYAHDFATAGNVYQKMINRNIISPVIQDIKLNNGTQLSMSMVNYNDWFGDSKLLEPISTNLQVGSNPVETRYYFNNYDKYGNILEQQKANDVKEVYLWGYNSQYPVAKLSNTTYAVASTYVNQSILDNPVDDAALKTQLNNLRNIPGAFVNTYTYAPLIGQTSATDPAGKTTSFEYDGYNRLKNIKDYQGNIVKNYQYNYGNSCGPNCVVLPMQTFTSYNTPSYPVGVFNGAKQYIGIATTQAQYVSLWNSNTANQAIGVLSANADMMHFNLTLATNAVAPPVVFGLRYYQWDITSSTTVTANTDYLSFVDWGDGTRELESGPNADITENGIFGYNSLLSTLHNEAMVKALVISHTYSTNQARTITVFHNETTQTVTINQSGINDLTDNANIRGYYPEKLKCLAYDQIGNSSDAGILNINNLSELVLVDYTFYTSPTTKHNNWQNLNNSHKLKWLKIHFKNAPEIVSNLKVNFPDLRIMELFDYKVDISQTWGSGGFANAYVILIGQLDASFNQLSLTSAEVDMILNAQGGTTISNGYFGTFLFPSRTSASIVAYNSLIARGWTLNITNP